MKRTIHLLLAGLVASATAGVARADSVLYNATPSSASWDYSTLGEAFMLDDAQFGPGVNNIKVSQVQFGLVNHTATAQNVDAVVSFWGAMNVNADQNTQVNTNFLGSAQFNGLTIAAGTSNGSDIIAMQPTGLLNLPASITVPNNAFGVEIDFFAHGTNTISSNVDALLVTASPTVGSTTNGFWSDGNDITGDDDHMFHGSFNGHVTGPDNFYLEVVGAPVPEPAGLTIIAGIGSLLLRRRRV